MAILSSVHREVAHTPTSVDSDIPSECRLYQRSQDAAPAEWWDAQRGHGDYEHTGERMYVQSVRAMLSVI
jgi:hypothetical protein